MSHKNLAILAFLFAGACIDAFIEDNNLIYIILFLITFWQGITNLNRYKEGK